MDREHLEHLGKILAEIRRRKGFSGRELALKAKISQSTISKFENGDINPTEDNLNKISSALGLTGEEKSRLISWRRLLSHPYAPFIPTEADELPAIQRALNQFEKNAHIIKVYQLLFIPGLIQSPGYIRAIFKSASVAHGDVRANTVKATINERIKRQKILEDPSKRFVFLIHENAFQAIGDKDILNEQIQMILKLCSQNNVIVGLIPSGQRWSGDLTVTSFDVIDDEIVLVETYRGLLYLWMESIIRDYISLFERIHVNCVFGETMEEQFDKMLMAF